MHICVTIWEMGRERRREGRGGDRIKSDDKMVENGRWKGVIREASNTLRQWVWLICCVSSSTVFDRIIISTWGEDSCCSLNCVLHHSADILMEFLWTGRFLFLIRDGRGELVLNASNSLGFIFLGDILKINIWDMCVFYLFYFWYIIYNVSVVSYMHKRSLSLCKT